MHLPEVLRCLLETNWIVLCSHFLTGLQFPWCFAAMGFPLHHGSSVRLCCSRNQGVKPMEKKWGKGTRMTTPMRHQRSTVGHWLSWTNTKHFHLFWQSEVLWTGSTQIDMLCFGFLPGSLKFIKVYIFQWEKLFLQNLWKHHIFSHTVCLKRRYALAFRRQNIEKGLLFVVSTNSSSEETKPAYCFVPCDSQAELLLILPNRSLTDKTAVTTFSCLECSLQFPAAGLLEGGSLCCMWDNTIFCWKTFCCEIPKKLIFWFQSENRRKEEWKWQERKEETMRMGDAESINNREN